MINRNIIKESKRKSTWSVILFWVHVSIFVVAAIFFFLELVIIFDWLKGPDSSDQEKFALFKKSFWALWGVVIVQVVGGIIALSKNLFGLSTKGEVVNVANESAELIDGLEREKIIPNEIANKLRERLSNISGRVAGTVLGR